MTVFVRLGDVCEYDKRQGLHSGLPYLGLEHIESGSGQFDLSPSNPDAKSQTFRFSDKHVLYGRLRPYLKKVALPGSDGRCSTEIFPILPRPGLDRSYLAYWLLSDETTSAINATCTGARMPRADMEAVLDLPFYVPSLKEQHRIVAILDEAFAGIATAKANAEKSLQNARTLFEVYLQSVFKRRGTGWVKKRLGDVFEIGSSKRIRETEWTSSGVPFYGGREIVKLAKSGSVVSNSYISEEKYREYASKYDMPRHGDILITARGTIGVGHVVQAGEKFYYKDGNIISMRGKVSVNPHYFLYAFGSNAIADQLGDLTGTTVRHLPIEKAKELVLWMPDFAGQNMVVSEVRRVESESQHLQSLYTRKLAALDALKQSLLHRAFSGQL